MGDEGSVTSRQIKLPFAPRIAKRCRLVALWHTALLAITSFLIAFIAPFQYFLHDLPPPAV